MLNSRALKLASTLFLAYQLTVQAPTASASLYPGLTEQRITEIERMLPSTPQGIGPRCADRSAWGKEVVASRTQEVVKAAEKLLDKTFPAWDDEAFLQYSRTGSRTNGERMMNARKAWIYPLALAECVEHKGRFLPSLETALNAIDDQPSWVWPAHDTGLRNFQHRNFEVDLLGADMAHDIAQALYLLGDAISPNTRKHTHEALEAHIFGPVRKTLLTANKDNWWLRANHNWNAVCTKGVVSAALAVIEDRNDRALFAAAAEATTKTYLSGFPDDGYSVEGPSYWNYGFSHFSALRDVLIDATQGHIDLFVDPKVSAAAAYGKGIEMLPGNIAPFADANPREKIDPYTMAYINEAFGIKPDAPPRTPPFSALPISAAHSGNTSPLAQASQILFSTPRAMARGLSIADPLRTWFAQSRVLVARPALSANTDTNTGTKLAISIKAGGNANHSHDDIGSFVVALGDEQPLGDIGKTPYTAKTFSKERNTIKGINSYGHPVPVVAGKLQSEARQVTTPVIATRFTPEADEVSFDLKPAYAVPELKILTRTARYSREAQGTFSLMDRFEFTAAESFETALTTLGQWQRQPDGSLDFQNGKAHLRVIIDASAAYAITGEKIEEEGMSYSRIAIRLQSPAKEGWVRMIMTPAP